MRRCLVFSILIFSFFVSKGQTPVKDTSRETLEDTVYTKTKMGEYIPTPIIKARERYTQTNKSSFIHEINAVTGVRMEERSPGSYRVNIRGSSLRAPFGVRNVKIYWNDIPLTDPGGNTYFNQLAFNNISSMTIFKSTTSVINGSGTGGQLIIANTPANKNGASLEIVGGSYQLKTLLADATFGSKDVRNKFSYAHNESDGYRDQSALRRDNFSWISDIKLSAKERLTASVLFTDMFYQTPGGLTLSEFEKTPQAARPVSGAFKSAVEMKASIKQKNLTGGLTYKNNFNATFTNTTTLYGSYNRIENSAIRNFEKRNEPHFGGRSIFEFRKKFNNDNTIQLQTGVELQTGDFNIKVFGNKNGIADTIQTNDDVATTQYSIFTQFNFLTSNKWSYDLSLSYNKIKTAFKRLSETPVLLQPFAFSNQIVPRFGITKWWQRNYSVTGLISKGFSAPTIAELLPSTGIINTSLEAEKGWNYELILRAAPIYKLNVDASLFSFRLYDALVQRRDDAGADYFLNAGSTQQNGIEISAAYAYLSNSISFIEDGNLRAAYSYNHFKYRNFANDDGDFSGNSLPGIPANTLSVTGDAYFKGGTYGIVSYYGASSIFLNDANTVSAKPYHLLTAKLGYDFSIKKIGLNLYLGADNLLNEKYSLGNDINAVGGRFYNAAPRRNYYAGAVLEYRKG